MYVTNPLPTTPLNLLKNPGHPIFGAPRLFRKPPPPLPLFLFWAHGVPRDKLTSSDKVEIGVYDEDKRSFGADTCDFEGRITIKMSNLLLEMPNSDSFILEKSWVLKGVSHPSPPHLIAFSPLRIFIQDQRLLLPFLAIGCGTVQKNSWILKIQLPFTSSPSVLGFAVLLFACSVLTNLVIEIKEGRSFQN